MRVLIVKLSSMGDVIHTLPVVQDILRAHPGARIDWVVEPAFAPLVRRARGIGAVIEAPIRHWMRRWWSSGTRSGLLRLKSRLREQPYDAILDLQGLTKSAAVAFMARGHRYAMARGTEGSGYEAPTRWVAHTALPVEFHIHALDRSRIVAAQALGYEVSGPPDFGLRAKLPASHDTAMPDIGSAAGDGRDHAGKPIAAFLHGASREDKLWPEDSWIALGQRLSALGWSIALPQGSPREGERARRIAEALGEEHAFVWPPMQLDALMDALAGCRAAVGVDSGLSHLAVALDLPHVQIYNFPTSWRTGPLAAHGHRHQRSLEGHPAPTLEEVFTAFCNVVNPGPDTVSANGDLMEQPPGSLAARLS